MPASDETQVGETGPSTRRVVNALEAYVLEGAAAFEMQRGERASSVVEEMMAALMGQLEGNLGHVVLWEQFLQTPGEVSDALVGVIAGLRCDSPAFDTWLSEAWARYEAYTNGLGGFQEA